MNFEFIPVNRLQSEIIEEMYSLMLSYYEGVSKIEFLADLSQKNYIILLSAEQTLVGFSTFKLIEFPFENQKYLIAFSGDTIIHEQHRNSQTLPISFGLLMNEIARKSTLPLYWLLISKGFRTYRFLPIYFKEFYPHFKQETPIFYKNFLNKLCLDFFGNRYNPLTGIISSNGQSLKNSSYDQVIIDQRNDPHISFFKKLNPNWYLGDELACLTHYSQDNLSPFIAQKLKRTEKLNPFILT